MRRLFEIPSDFVPRFLRAAECGPVETSGARQEQIWYELAIILGFDPRTVERVSADEPRLFTAEEPSIEDARLAATHRERVRCIKVVTDVIKKAIPGSSPHEAIRLTTLGTKLMFEMAGAGYAPPIVEISESDREVIAESILAMQRREKGQVPS